MARRLELDHVSIVYNERCSVIAQLIGGEAKLIEGVPRVVKIASRDVIDSVIGSALPGVVLTHASPPPAPIPTRVGFKYFQLDNIGPYWNGIAGSKVISVYVPNDIPDEKIELYAVKP